jgi:hypothetical protein
MSLKLLVFFFYLSPFSVSDFDVSLFFFSRSRPVLHEDEDMYDNKLECNTLKEKHDERKTNKTRGLFPHALCFLIQVAHRIQVIPQSRPKLPGILMASTPCGIIRGFMELFESESLTQMAAFKAALFPSKEDVPGMFTSVLCSPCFRDSPPPPRPST